MMLSNANAAKLDEANRLHDESLRCRQLRDTAQEAMAEAKRKHQEATDALQAAEEAEAAAASELAAELAASASS